MKPRHSPMVLRVALLVLFCVVGSYSAAQGQSLVPGDREGPSYLVFDAPNASSTTVTGINNAGDVTGYFQDTHTSTTRGFLRERDGKILVFDAVANANNTMSVSINDPGDVAGYFFDAIGVHSFLRDADGKITVFDVPQFYSGAPTVGFAMTINNSDEIAGYIIPQPGDDSWVGFERDRHGVITTFKSIPDGSVPTSINDRGIVVGVTSPFYPVRDGFVRYRDGNITVFDIGNGLGPRAYPVGINNSEEITGYFYDSSLNTDRGFVRKRNGNIIVFDATTSSGTSPASINESNVIVGDFSDITGSHNFLRSETGKITVFDVPNAPFAAHAVSINDRGDVAGYFAEEIGKNRGFVRIANPRD